MTSRSFGFHNPAFSCNLWQWTSHAFIHDHVPEPAMEAQQLCSGRAMVTCLQEWACYWPRSSLSVMIVLPLRSCIGNCSHGEEWESEKETPLQKPRSVKKLEEMVLTLVKRCPSMLWGRTWWGRLLPHRHGGTHQCKGLTKGGCDPVGNLDWSRFLAGPVALGRKEPMLEQVCR